LKEGSDRRNDHRHARLDFLNVGDEETENSLSWLCLVTPPRDARWANALPEFVSES
jgi:hypothetical protein